MPHLPIILFSMIFTIPAFANEEQTDTTKKYLELSFTNKVDVNVTCRLKDGKYDVDGRNGTDQYKIDIRPNKMPVSVQFEVNDKAIGLWCFTTNATLRGSVRGVIDERKYGLYKCTVDTKGLFDLQLNCGFNALVPVKIESDVE